MATATTTGIQVRDFDHADERREPPLARVDVLASNGMTLGHAIFQPGWRWSESVKPIAGTASCEVQHHAYVVRGSMTVHMDDGSERTLSAGDVAVIPPGHDAWTNGDEPCEMLEFSTQATDTYALPPQT